MFNYIAIAHLASLAHQRFGTLQPKPQSNHHCHRSSYQNHYYRRVQIIRLPCNLIHVFTASEKIQTHKSQCGYHHHRRDLLNQPGAGWHIALTQFSVHQLQYNKNNMFIGASHCLGTIGASMVRTVSNPTATAQLRHNPKIATDMPSRLWVERNITDLL